MAMILRLITAKISQVFVLKDGLNLIGAGSDVDHHIAIEKCPELLLQVTVSGAHVSATASGAKEKIVYNGKSVASSSICIGDVLDVQSFRFVVDHSESLSITGNASNSSVSTSALHKSISEQLQNNLEKLASVFSNEKDPQKAMDELLQLCMQSFKATQGCILTITSDQKLRSVATTGLSQHKVFSESIVQSCINTKTGIVWPSTSIEIDQNQSVRDLGLVSVMCMPMLVGQKVRGVIYLASRNPGMMYSIQELPWLSIYASLSGMIAYNVEYLSQVRQSYAKIQQTTQAEGFLAGSPKMIALLKQIEPVSASDLSILILGETGTGKEVLAKFLHQKSARKNGPFIAINCSSLRGELLESELFGYRRGAFTGALADRTGLFHAAHNGTLFLDEIAEMDVNLQAKILRVLESGMLRRVGDAREEAVNVRILAATHRDIHKMVEEKTFRQDLYYRLAQMTVTIPPLRERGEDIYMLAHHYLQTFVEKYPHKHIEGFHPDALIHLSTYNWPGNVRELIHTLHRCFLSSPGSLLEIPNEKKITAELTLDEATQNFQRDFIGRVLARLQGNREDAAKALGMSRSTFFRYLSQLGLTGGEA